MKIFIAFPVGGLLDTVSRIVGEKLAGLLGQQFIIEARPGAGGTLATAAVAKADPDGYTLMMINDNHALNPSVFKNIPYDSVKDFAPIGFVGYTPLILAAHPSVAGEGREGAGGDRQDQAGRRHLRVGRRRQRQPSGGRNARHRGGREAAARPLSRRRAGAERPDRRSRQHAVPEPGDRARRTCSPAS